MRTPRRWLPLVAVAALSLYLGSCSKSTAPTAELPNEGQALFDGSADPTGGGFVWKRIDGRVPHMRPLSIELIASNIEVDVVAGTVRVDVAIRNTGETNLFGPGEILLSRFVPEAVRPTNADVVQRPPAGSDPESGSPIYVYVYDRHFGADGTLEPGELSEARMWVFTDPQLVSFSFAARARFGFQPTRPHIGGRVFEDLDRNGKIDPDDRPFSSGFVSTIRRDGEPAVAQVDERGFYILPIDEPGLYRVEYVPPPTLAPFAALCFTTPNPLEVLLPPGPDGGATSFEQAHFGLYTCGSLPRIQLTDVHPDSVRLAPYDLQEVAAVRDPSGHYLLHLTVGFSGCSPDHRFQLFAGRAFMESFPVQTWSALRHDDFGEPCDAYFVRELEFDLQPLFDAYVRAYGQLDPIILVFQDYFGEQTRVRLEP